MCCVRFAEVARDVAERLSKQLVLLVPGNVPSDQR